MGRTRVRRYCPRCRVMAQVDDDAFCALGHGPLAVARPASGRRRLLSGLTGAAVGLALYSGVVAAALPVWAGDDDRRIPPLLLHRELIFGSTSAPAPVSRGGVVAARPVGVMVHSIEVWAAVRPVRTDAAGKLAVPSDPMTVGWYAGGGAPGEREPTVLVGHLDSRSGPGVFQRLAELERDDAVTVVDSRGRWHDFVVTSVVEQPKSRFPTSLVYGPTPRSSLRLITCGGDLDETGHYRNNVIVLARSV